MFKSGDPRQGACEAEKKDDTTLFRLQGKFAIQRSLALLAVLGASNTACTTAIMVAFKLPAALLPAVFFGLIAVLWVGLKGLSVIDDEARLTGWESALMLYALGIGVIRLVPYASQYVVGELSAAATWDDHWHFQELASLVTTHAFPPRLNFAPQFYFHFYYLPWIPAAVLSDILQLLTGNAYLKFTYGLNALVLDTAATFIVILFFRHVLPPAARGCAAAALILLGALPDSLYAAYHLMNGRLIHPEFWQRTMGGIGEYSTWTTLLVWVPHHLIAAACALLAVIVVTEPISLAPRHSVKVAIAGGMLLAFTLFSSVFVFIGALAAFLPLAGRFLEVPRFLATLVVVAAVVSLPLSYIYLNSDASAGFRFGEAFTLWRTAYGSAAFGFVGVAVATLYMLLEVGWIPLHASVMARRLGNSPTILTICTAISSVYLLSTVVMGFSGANNYMMRGAIVPSLVVACFWAQQFTVWRTTAERAAAKMLYALVAFASIAQITELLLFTRDSLAATLNSGESAECKRRILALNTSPTAPVDVTSLAGCRNRMSIYSVERQFQKPTYSDEDRELMGHGL